MTDNLLSDLLNPLDVTAGAWLITAGCAFVVGLSKSGIKGVAMVTIPTLAFLYGGMRSTGVLVPMLIVGDLFALQHFRAHTRWSHVRRLLPTALLGIAIATVVGSGISDEWFRRLMAFSMLLCLLLLALPRFRSRPTTDAATHASEFSKSRVPGTATGVLGGFATMIGNAAGPILDLYLLAMRLPKNEFIATGAVFFLTLNLVKLPLHLWVWESITLQVLQMNALLIPAVFVGAWSGRRLVFHIPERGFRVLVLCVTGLSAILLLF